MRNTEREDEFYKLINESFDYGVRIEINSRLATLWVAYKRNGAEITQKELIDISNFAKISHTLCALTVTKI